jgi:hypothetical protein
MGLSVAALARVHGVLAWIAIVALGAALIAMWKRPGVARALVPAAALSGGLAFASGVALHLPFQSKLRQPLFLMSNLLGWLFERKEHVAFGALALLVCGLSAWIGAWRAAGRDDEIAAHLRRASMTALCGALAFEVLAAAVSVAAAARVRF